MAVASQVLVEEGPTGAGVVEMVVTATSLWHRGRSHLTRNPARRQKGQGRLFARFRLGSICSAHSVTRCTGEGDDGSLVVVVVVCKPVQIGWSQQQVLLMLL